MCRPRTKFAARAVTAAVAVAALGAVLAGCSDVYTDRRETVALGADDAVAANMVEQMVDPWPRYSNNNNIPFNGQKMQRAVECYRLGKVTPPVDLDPVDDAGSGSSGAAAAPTATACGADSSAGAGAQQAGTASTLTSTAAK